ncbi:hypothetical protein B0H17DRAFT_1005364 [Mycena rosella]|uniref:Xylanolytic transcriptional activator regulatory domain-containing protein n=1 Tax=Mycena rosella TaxID=1033263 RepID=A0AAD7DVP0_MYCRO|nr:hypothetical protein B0H17DRAFT_1005364 [Mycena rosella]
MSSHYSTRSLPKGHACVDCRCDSVRPICGPCTRAARFEDCEYVDGAYATSNVQQLEESIHRIQHRIMDLERPRNTSPHVSTLKNPYSGNSEGHSRNPPASQSQQHIGVDRYIFRISPANSWPVSRSARNETNVIVVQTLRLALDTFAPYAHEVGFFLNQKRFRNTCLHTRDDNEELPAGLLSAICLWAAYVSSAGPLASQESNFLSQALPMATAFLSSGHRLKILYGIQTEVLLCQYLLHKGRLVEAQYHLSLAVSHVVLGNLSSIRSARGVIPQDSIEEGELIAAFWTVFSMDKIWSSALNFPSNFVSASNIDTPWPLETEEYERSPRSEQLQSENTVQRFIEDVSGADRGVSCLAILAKSAILLERATNVAGQWRPNMSPSETTAFFKSFTTLNNRIKRFRDSLLNPNALASCTIAMKPRIILAQSVAHAATIQLNRTFIAANPQCRELCLTACQSIVWIMRAAGIRKLGYINPIVGPIWSATGQVLLEEIRRLGAVHTSAAVFADLKSAYDEIVASITCFSRNCPFMGTPR